MSAESFGGGSLKQQTSREFPGGPVVRTWCFHCHGPGSIPSGGNKIWQAVQHGKKKKYSILFDVYLTVVSRILYISEYTGEWCQG